MNKFKVIIAGGRTFSDYNLLAEKMDKLLWHVALATEVEIVSGTARGADALGEQYAASAFLKVKRFPAQWDKYGRSAGYKRNEQMAEYADGLVAFWDGKSRGTMHMINIAKAAGLKVRVVRYG